MPDTEKRCFKCGETKPLDEFYRHKMMADGHLNKCKECTCRDVREHRAQNREYYSNYDATRYRAEGHRGTPTAEARRRGGDTWAKRNPEKRIAQLAAGNAIRSGRLIRKPCEECGSSESVDAHHDDYSKPLEVKWLCRKCHAKTWTRVEPRPMVPPSGRGGWGRTKTF